MYQDDQCLNNQCQNESTCQPLRTAYASNGYLGYSCKCLNGTAGPFCNYSKLKNYNFSVKFYSIY